MAPPLARRNKHQPVCEATAFCPLWGSDLLERTKLGHVHPRMTNDFQEKDAVLCFKAEFVQTTRLQEGFINGRYSSVSN